MRVSDSGIACSGVRTREVRFLLRQGRSPNFMLRLLMTCVALLQFLEYFFTDADAEFFRSLGLNCIRIAINYRHFEGILVFCEDICTAVQSTDLYRRFKSAGAQAQCI
jgi:hypothetical protein